MYDGARRTRLTSDWPTMNGSADSELATSLVDLRARSRALIRNASYAKRAKVIVVNNVVGAGIGLQAQVKTTRDEMAERVNDGIEKAWCDWTAAARCHTGGTLHFSDLERAAMGQVFEAGEVFIRKHYAPFGDSKVPFALELIEAERVADDTTILPTTGAAVRMGVEVDKFYRPVAYWIRERHPSEFRWDVTKTDRYERVPAEFIFHLKITDRWPQTRGEPWLHSVVGRLNDMNGYSEAEIVAARGAASYMAVIETPDDNSPLMERQDDGSSQFTVEPGISARLAPGEKLNFVSPNRPNPNMDPFLRLMLREVAAGVGVSYESLSRDYSQSNYSSSRLALIDDRDLWRTFQRWFIRSFREPLHRDWMRQAVLAGAIPEISVEQYALNRQKFEAMCCKPRGWSWIDPTKEVEAYREAVRCGFMTVADVIALTGSGMDLEDVLGARRRELDMMSEKDLQFDTDPTVAAPALRLEGGQAGG
jgi:lambda family phage portal protein